MALNRDFYADCFARAAVGRFDRARATPRATPFAAAAKKEFDLTSFLKDLAAVRARDGDARERARTRAKENARRARCARDGPNDVARASARPMGTTRGRDRGDRARGIKRDVDAWTYSVGDSSDVDARDAGFERRSIERARETRDARAPARD
jgi:hypothetical protein